MEIFKVNLTNINEMLKKVQKLGKEVTKINTPLKKFEKTMHASLRVAQTMSRVFDKIYSVVKGLGIGSILGFGGIGLRGLMALKTSAESKRLGLQTQEKGALEFAGSQAGLGKDFFKNLLENIRKTSLTDEGLDLFGSIGLDSLQISKMPALEALQSTIQALQATSIKTDANTFERLLQGIAGIDTFQFKAIDFKKFNADFQEGLKYHDNSAEKIKGIGEGVNRLTANFQLLGDKILASLSPAIEKIFNNISKGLNAIATNKAFQQLLDKIGDWATRLTSKFDDTIIGVVQNIPQILRDLQIALLSITGTLINVAEAFVFGDADTRLKSTRSKIEAYRNELEKRGEIEQKAKESQYKAIQLKPVAVTPTGLRTSPNGGKAEPAIVNIQVDVKNDPLNQRTQQNFVQNVGFGGSNGGTY